MQLFIGNKNYSSWSMRPWILMRQLGMAFEEVKLRLDFAPGSPFQQRLAKVTPSGRVPVLVDDGFSVWDTLAIVEYLHERFPQAGVWPAFQGDRARARSVCAEMHAGFAALRTHCPMNIEAHLPEVGARLWVEREDVRRDVQRIEHMWAQQLQACGGPMLFGAFSAADAFYAPVATRIRTYALPVGPEAQDYIDRLCWLPAAQAWIADALAEHDFLEEDEPYRARPEAAAR